MSNFIPFVVKNSQGGRYGIRFSLGAQNCEVFANEISDSVRYGVFFFRGSDEAEVCPYFWRAVLAYCSDTREAYGDSTEYTAGFMWADSGQTAVYD